MNDLSTNTELPTLNLGTICARLGFNVTQQFLEQVLRMPPAGKEKAARLYTESDWATICRRLRAHIATLPRPEIPPPGGWTGIADADQVLSLLNGMDVDSTADDASIEQAMALVRGLARQVVPVGDAPAKPKPLDDPELQELFGNTIIGAMAFGSLGTNPPPAGHWLQTFWDMGRKQALQLEAVGKAAPAPAMPADLQDLPKRLLAPREIVRDENGFYWHPDLPLCDESVSYVDLLAALGVDAAFVSLQDDDELYERYVSDHRSVVSSWNPAPPAGAEWTLLAIFDHEDGPFALFGLNRKEVTHG